MARKEGMTLLSGLLALQICVVTLFGLFMLYHQMVVYRSHLLQPRIDESLLIEQMGRECRGIRAFSISDDGKNLYFDTANGRAGYHFEKNTLYRELDGAGYEIVLKDIKTVTFGQSEGLLNIRITGMKGSVRLYTIWHVV